MFFEWVCAAFLQLVAGKYLCSVCQLCARRSAAGQNFSHVVMNSGSCVLSCFRTVTGRCSAFPSWPDFSSFWEAIFSENLPWLLLWKQYLCSLKSNCSYILKPLIWQLIMLIALCLASIVVSTCYLNCLDFTVVMFVSWLQYKILEKETCLYNSQNSDLWTLPIAYPVFVCFNGYGIDFTLDNLLTIQVCFSEFWRLGSLRS